MNNFYNTKNKNLVYDFFLNNPESSFTAKEVIKNLGDVPKATVYRLLDNLVNLKLLRKSFKENSYEYQLYNNCQNHFHLKCRNCGKIIHLECLKANDLINHILLEHGFKIDLGDSHILGLCKECSVC